MVGVMRQTGHFAMSMKALGRRMHTPHSIVVAVAMVGIISLLVILFIFALSMKTQYSQQSSTQIQYQSSATSRSPSAPESQTTSKASSSMSIGGSQQSVVSEGQTKPTVHTNVSVNGKSVPLPAGGNGSVHKVITSNDGGKTSVDITVKSQSSSSTSSNLDLNVESNQMSVYNSE